MARPINCIGLAYLIEWQFNRAPLSHVARRFVTPKPAENIGKSPRDFPDPSNGVACYISTHRGQGEAIRRRNSRATLRIRFAGRTLDKNGLGDAWHRR